jgi:hypothetical protein
MREVGLRARQPRAYKRTTVPSEEPVTSADLIGRDFTAAVPGQAGGRDHLPAYRGGMAVHGRSTFASSLSGLLGTPDAHP